MRRGFLLSKPETSGRSKRSAPDPAKAPPKQETQSNVIAIPCGSVYTRSYSELPDPSQLSNVIISCLPQEYEDEPYTPTLLYTGMKEAILASPGYPSRLKQHRKVYRIGPAGDSGMGMFATENLDTGDLVLYERPLIISPIAMLAPPDQPPEYILEQLFIRLSDERREAYWALHNCKDDRPAIKGILDTNAIELVSLPGYNAQVGAVCQEISRINHSCCPTLAYRWHTDTFCFELRATTRIRKGEQMFISYNDPLAPRKTRQEQIARYKFICRCPACSLPPEESKRSDELRATVAMAVASGRLKSNENLKGIFKHPTIPIEPMIKECEDVVERMFKDQSYDPQGLPEYTEWICKAYCALGDLENAKKWAKRMRKLTLAFHGTDGGWEAVANAPQNTDWWALRRKPS